MAAPAFRSASTLTWGGAATSVTPAAPAGATNGDILFFVATNNNYVAPLALTANGTGWTEVAVTTGGFQSKLWWYRVSGSVPTMPTADASGGGTNYTYGQTFAFSGCVETGDPFESAGVVMTTASGTATPGVAVTSTGADRLAVQIFVTPDDTGVGSTDGGYTEVAETSSTAGAVDITVAVDVLGTGAATVPAPTRTIATSESSRAAFGFALLPTAGGGGTDGNASGASLTTTASLTAGSASGIRNATATGVALLAVASLLGGTPSGQQNPTANGASLTATSSLTTGAASGGASAAGASLTTTSSLTPGSASGVRSPTVNGETLTATVSFTAGSASAAGNATAAGASLTSTASLTAGAASGGASVAGQSLISTVSFVPGSADVSAAGNATGASYTITASLTEGVATATSDGAATGAAYQVSASLTSGTATGIRNGTATGLSQTITASLTAGQATSFPDIVTPESRRVVVPYRARRVTIPAKGGTYTVPYRARRVVIE